MPNENINRAIKKGSGDIEGDTFEEIVYEGYAPGGVAVMLEIATDNRNRTASEIRHLFSKYGGNLGENGCVAWMFKRCGVIIINKEKLKMDEEEFLLQALDCGSEDVKDEGDYYELITLPENLMEVKENLEKEGFILEEADIVLLPENMVEITDEEMALKVIKLVDLLEDHDDVQKAYTNMSINDSVLEKLS